MNRIIAIRVVCWWMVLVASTGRDVAAQTEALCRVFVEEAGTQSIGSGTLVCVTADGGEGLVLTCAHVIGSEPGRIVVEFPGKLRHVGRLVDIDPTADLAAIAIGRPIVSPVEFSPSPATGQTVQACGFGGDGTPRCVSGDIVGHAVSAGQRSIVLRGAVRSGDSGGCVLDSSGRLVAVIWGQLDGMTYATAGVPLQRFVDRLLPRRGHSVAQAPTRGCFGGSCPVPPSSKSPVTVSPQPPRRPVLDRLSADRLEARLAAIEEKQASFLTRDDLNRLLPIGTTSPEISSSPFPWWFQAAPSLISRAIGGLLPGVSLAAGAGLVGFAGWRAWRRWGKSGNYPMEPSQEATAAAEAHFRHEAAPIERDDAEARQLLRLSQLEGRDPLQDALAGRLAIDRLDALAESDVDPKRAEWADRLRRELRERFNEVSPTNFSVVCAAS